MGHAATFAVNAVLVADKWHAVDEAFP